MLKYEKLVLQHTKCRRDGKAETTKNIRKKKNIHNLFNVCYLCRRDFDPDFDLVRSYVSMALANWVSVDFSMQPVLAAQPPV